MRKHEAGQVVAAGPHQELDAFFLQAAEAFRRTLNQSLELLKREGIEVGKDVVGVIVEAVVGKLKTEKNGLRGEAAA